MDCKSILRVTFNGDVYAHYVIDSRDEIYVDDKTSLAEIKCYLKSLSEVVMCPETFNDVIGIAFFSIHNDYEV